MAERDLHTHLHVLVQVAMFHRSKVVWVGNDGYQLGAQMRNLGCIQDALSREEPKQLKAIVSQFVKPATPSRC